MLRSDGLRRRKPLSRCGRRGVGVRVGASASALDSELTALPQNWGRPVFGLIQPSSAADRAIADWTQLDKFALSQMCCARLSRLLPFLPKQWERCWGIGGFVPAFLALQETENPHLIRLRGHHHLVDSHRFIRHVRETRIAG